MSHVLNSWYRGGFYRDPIGSSSEGILGFMLGVLTLAGILTLVLRPKVHKDPLVYVAF